MLSRPTNSNKNPQKTNASHRIAITKNSNSTHSHVKKSKKITISCSSSVAPGSKIWNISKSKWKAVRHPPLPPKSSPTPITTPHSSPWLTKSTNTKTNHPNAPESPTPAPSPNTTSHCRSSSAIRYPLTGLPAVHSKKHQLKWEIKTKSLPQTISKKCTCTKWKSWNRWLMSWGGKIRS